MIVYKYCTQCRSELDVSGTYPVCPRCQVVYYRNSKPTVGILPVNEGKVLLARRAVEPYRGAFDIIGGFLEDGEHPLAGAVREAREETGLEIEPLEMLGIYVDRYGDGGDHTLNIHYIGRVRSGEMKAQEDVASLHWLLLDDLALHEGFWNTQEALRDLQRWYAARR